MSFTLEVRFFGLCHFISNSNPVPPGGVGMCVVLADAPGHDRKITVNQGTLTHSTTGAPFPGPLSRQLVDLKLTGGQAGGSFTFNSVVNGVLAALDFGLLLPGLAKADPDILRPEPPPVPSTVQAQILLRGGTLGPDPAASEVPWNLPASVLNPSPQSVKVAAKALWTLTVDSANVGVTPFGGQEELYVLTPNGTPSKAVLEISNECSGGGSTIDEDFIFHYPLLDPGTRAEIIRQIGGPLDLAHLRSSLPSRGATQAQVLLSHFKNSINVAGEGAEIERLLAEIGRINSKFTSGGPTGCNCLTCSNGAADIKFP